VAVPTVALDDPEHARGVLIRRIQAVRLDEAGHGNDAVAKVLASRYAVGLVERFGKHADLKCRREAGTRRIGPGTELFTGRDFADEVHAAIVPAGTREQPIDDA